MRSVLTIEYSGGGRPVPGCLKLRGYDLEAAIPGCLHAILSHPLAADPPLRLQHRLYDVFAAAAEGHTHLIVLSLPQQPLAIQPLHHSLTYLRWQTVWCRWQLCKCVDSAKAAAESANRGCAVHLS